MAHAHAQPAEDFGTAELHRQHLVVIEGTGRRHARVADQRPLDRYAIRRELCREDRRLNAAMYAAGCRLRDDWTMAGLEPRVIANLLRIGPSKPTDIMTRKDYAHQRCIAALRHVGEAISDILVDVVCLDKEASQWIVTKKWSHRPADGAVILRLGLARLAEHYGLLR